jgi:phage shock protein PspC (stress-responsive transcriptional regulator)
MNKVVTINLNGNAYQLEELGYEALRVYLDSAAQQLEGNPDRDEIIADIEQAIGEKCRALTGPYRTVVHTKQIEQIIAEMGDVDDGSTSQRSADPKAPRDAGQPKQPNPGADRPPVRRIYRIQEGAMLSGVCNGTAAYFNLDPTIVRVVFVLLSFLTFGGMVLAYVILSLVLPSATTPDEKAAAQGAPSTAQEFIRRAREGYYDATKHWGDKQARREWKRKFRYEMRGWRNQFHREAQTWQSNWQSSWASHPGAYRGLWFTLSVLSLVSAVITFGWILASVSLLTSGAVFGISFPPGVPLWAGLSIVFVVFQLVLSPLRAARHGLARHGWGGSPCAPALFGLSDGLVWLSVLVLLVWLADRYVPEAHRAFTHLPHALNAAAESVRNWWSRS